jgi:hypothetical protein
MNSATIIAACAVSARRRNSANYTQYFTKDFEFYYVVKLRKYYHFEPMTLVKANYEPCYVGSIYAPILQSDVQITPVRIEAKTVGVEKIFTVYSKNCPNGIDNYVEENIDRYVESGVWAMTDREVLYTYIDELNKKYNIELDKDSLKYTTQYCWEVESDVH